MGAVYATCTEHVPEGSSRPKLIETFPMRGLAGFALPLEVVVEHGAGETVLPQGVALQTRGVEVDALSRAGFVVPLPDGGAPPRVEPMGAPGSGRTKVVLQLLALPKEPGRHQLELPPLPIAVARASGELVTLCTRPHSIVIEDPTASTPDAKPKSNPTPRRQREDWALARLLSGLLAVAVLAAIAGALFGRWWKRRPKPIVPPPPPRPPWAIALAELEAVRRGTLIEEEKLSEHVDRVSDIVRQYLGARFGFDGLEATSREVRRAVRNVKPPLPVLAEIDRLLDESDLVKFARVTPAPEDCRVLLELGETIVRATMPAFAELSREGAHG